MILKKYNTCLCVLLGIMFLITTINPAIQGTADQTNDRNLLLHIDHLSTTAAYPTESVTIYGTGFGATTGHVIITGQRISPTSWSDTQIVFTVPRSGASGTISVRDATNTKSNSIAFTVLRDLPAGQFEPYGFQLMDTGLPGAAFLVETDGAYLYGITGFETLCTYRILEDGSYEFCSRFYLSQRVGDLKIFNGYLFVAGDQGLTVYRCRDLQNNTREVVAAIAGGSFITCDIKEKNGSPIDCALLALCEYLPVWGTTTLRVPLYQFDSEELDYLGCYTRTVTALERYQALSIDPLNPKLYVSGFKTLLGSDKYLLEVDISNLDNIQLLYRLEMGSVMAFDMETTSTILWTGVVSTGTTRFLVYQLHPGSTHLSLAQTVTGQYAIGRATRVKIIDDTITVGCGWSGERPDVYLMDTFHSGTTPLATANSIDWAFDVTGYPFPTDTISGKIIIADEWGGFLTYAYTDIPSYTISHEQDYDNIRTGVMTQEISAHDGTLYVADRGAGVWSAQADDLSEESQWKSIDWEWTEATPQPNPISALCIREDSTYGTLIAALGHDKTMNWGTEVYGVLYKETSDDIEFLASSDAIDPPGAFSTGFSVIWPEPDLVYMLTGSDGFRAFVINPDEPSIRIHSDCLTQGFGSDSFSTSNAARYMVLYNQKLLIGSDPGLLVGAPTFHVYNVSYPEGVPDRNHPDRHITVAKETDLKCTKYKTIYHIDITPTGMIALTTSQGVAVFDISWIPHLNTLSDTDAWNLIKIPDDTYQPWWTESWTSEMADARFADDATLFVVKSPQGVWKIDLEIDASHYTFNSRPAGYYPGVQCGINYSQLLEGWENPDIITLHHPYGLLVDDNDIYVHGWSGKVNRLSFSVTNLPPSPPSITGQTNGKINTEYKYTFTATDPEGKELSYFIDWGDGSKEQWIGYNGTGESYTIGHTWTKKGTYHIKAKVMEEDKGVSYWGTYDVTMPKDLMIDHPFLQLLQRLLGHFPMIRSLIEQLL